MIRRVLVLVVFILGCSQAPCRGSTLSLEPAQPQDRVVDGPGESRSDAREWELTESDFQQSEDGDGSSLKVELILGVGFLGLVLLVAFWRRGRDHA